MNGIRLLGMPGRVLADRAGGVRADRVEVAQQRDPPATGRRARRRAGSARSSPWSSRRGWWPRSGSPRRSAPGRARRTPSPTTRTPACRTPCRCIAATSDERRAEVVLVVLAAALDGLADGLEPGEVDHRVDLLAARTGARSCRRRAGRTRAPAGARPASASQPVDHVGLALAKLSTTTTSWPAATSWTTVCEPM